MAWKWNPFKRGKGKAEAPAPAPAPTQAPTPDAKPSKGEKKPGRLKRLFSRKPKPTEPAPEAPPAPPAAPSAPPGPPQAPAPEAGGDVGEGEQGELFEVEEEEEEERQFPGSLGVSADGVWMISTTEWDSVMQGVLTGEDVKEFILAIEAGNQERAAEMVAAAYDENVGSLINVGASTIRRIGY
ncbi:hypothetical protein [Streptomyces durocortorensis]|uniref:Uncharacterized protein n=1 Tax=Streptomyces durocortorensis TaxID=2811104 RepID=A0ABS2I1S2_9ACTN|nr:hypothetical protein [Streptomyces durocortorensis]MBM7057169.1 hypothetical protein [Streptomyces durocortorensis]